MGWIVISIQEYFLGECRAHEMHGVLPTVESGKPVKQQVEGLLAFAEALHRNHRADAKFRDARPARARRWSRAAARRDDQDGDAVSPRRENGWDL
eukprot:s471_g2.t1